MTYEGVIMNDPAPMVMGSGTIMSMGSGFYTATINPSPDPCMSRYDMFCVGVDGVLDYHVGVPAAVNPQKPVVPTGY
jgi:hypothetical protein